MSEQDNVATIRGIYEAFGRGDIPHIIDQLDPEVEWYVPPTVPYSKGLHRGPAEVAQFFAAIADHVTRPSVEPHELLPTGDRVIVFLAFRGKGAQSGAPFETPEVHVWRLSAGKVVEESAYADTAAIVHALTAPAGAV